MKVEHSAYIRRNQPLFQELLRLLLKEYPYASILAQDSRERSYRVNRALSSVGEDSRDCARGFVVRVWDGARVAEHSFNRISEERMPELVERVRRAVADAPLPEGVEDAACGAPDDEPLTFCDATEYEIDPALMGDDAILSRLMAIRDRTLSRSDKLLDCIAQATWNRTTKLFLSPRRELTQSVLWTTGAVIALAARGQEIKDSMISISNLGGMELLDRLEAGADRVADTVVELLDSLPMVPGEYDCVCTPEVTGMIVHEAFGHGVEMDMFVKKRALAERFVGERVASPLVTMRDGAASAPQTGSYFFDDEGVMAHDTVVIDRGVLHGGISDARSAALLGTVPTGNGRRESYRRKAYTRMTNTFFEGGSDRVEDMIASIRYGFLLEEPASGMEDPKNWGIQCMVNFAREIRDGKLTGRVFSPIVLTGYVPDLLKSITAMSPEVELSGGGFCGKGYKEWVKVSDGGPYIKARIRLG